MLQRQNLLVAEAARHGRVETLAEVFVDGSDLPIYGVHFGPTDPRLPVLLVVGGVHGVERIGAEVALASLEVFLQRLSWCRMTRWQVEQCRLIFVPIVNPGGLLRQQRPNPQGVDLMRNAPARADGWTTPLVGGQRFSPLLPWYQGREDAPMEIESAALVRLVDQWVLPAEKAMVLDLHSGFGMTDRLWFPYARTRKPFAGLADVYALKALLDRTLSNHVYKLEPQATVYTTQGDLWDYVFDEHLVRGQGVFLPLTLEMGSWAWVRKNPVQLASVGGSFNPMVPHRLRRILRRHLLLIDFLHRATCSMDAWAPQDGVARRALRERAFATWYGGKPSR